MESFGFFGKGGSSDATTSGDVGIVGWRRHPAVADFRLDEKMRLIMELAFNVGAADFLMQHRQEADARRFGMSGAEIDAARRGQSFDRRVALALALALADEDSDIDEHRARAIKAGVAPGVTDEIERYARRLRTTLGWGGSSAE